MLRPLRSIKKRWGKIQEALERRLSRIRARRQASPINFDWDWSSVPYGRSAVINALVADLQRDSS